MNIQETPQTSSASAVMPCWANDDGSIQLYNSDCLDVLPFLYGVDAVITDPPYGISADKKKAHSSIRDNEKWIESEWNKERPSDRTLRLLPIFSQKTAIWGGNYFADCFPPCSGWLVWRKPQAETGFSMADAELCWTSEEFSCRMKTSNRRDGNLHPTQKPVSIILWTMEQVKVNQGATVLDPFMGSGTTGIACIRSGRKFIGIEKDEKYFEIAKKRIQKELQQGRLW